ncbi:MAG: hypothetical protein LLF89_08365 [Spirochaetaceae bacterium]|nr:hypothetical protein [Spirochaetaceae bacterium]
MKKYVIVLAALVIAAGPLFAMDIGVDFTRNMTPSAGANPDSYGAFFRYFGDNYLGLELNVSTPSTKSPGGTVFENFQYLVTNLGSIEEVNVFPYVLFNYQVKPAVFYAGIAPTISFSKPWPTFAASFTNFDAKAGIQLNFLFLGAYAEAGTKLTFKPFTAFQDYHVNLGAAVRF